MWGRETIQPATERGAINIEQYIHIHNCNIVYFVPTLQHRVWNMHTWSAHVWLTRNSTLSIMKSRRVSFPQKFRLTASIVTVYSANSVLTRSLVTSGLSDRSLPACKYSRYLLRMRNEIMGNEIMLKSAHASRTLASFSVLDPPLQLSSLAAQIIQYAGVLYYLC